MVGFWVLNMGKLASDNVSTSEVTHTTKSPHDLHWTDSIGVRPFLVNFQFYSCVKDMKDAVLMCRGFKVFGVGGYRRLPAGANMARPLCVYRLDLGCK